MDSAGETVPSVDSDLPVASPTSQDEPGLIYYAISDFQADESDQVVKKS